VEFAEFIVLMEFLRRADSEPATLVRLRGAFNSSKPKKGRAAARAKDVTIGSVSVQSVQAEAISTEKVRTFVFLMLIKIIVKET
jgi:hypothetical protein